MAIRFNFITNREGIHLLIQELLNTFGEIEYRDYMNNIYSVEDKKDFTYDYFQPIKIYKKSMKEYIESKNFSLYFSPIIEYQFIPSKENPNIGGGELVYFAGNEFPEFKKDIQELFKRLKKKCKRISSKFHPYFNLTDIEILSLLDN